MDQATYLQSELTTNNASYFTTALGATSSTFAIIMFTVFFAVFALAYIINSILLGRIFKKAGVKPAIAWIPFYNIWKLLELGDQKGFWAILAIIPPLAIVSAIFTYIAMYHIGKKFSKPDWFVALAIFLPIVWLIILGFGKDQWNSPAVATPLTPAAPEASAPAEVATAPITAGPEASATAEPTTYAQDFSAPVSPVTDTEAPAIPEAPAIEPQPITEPVNQYTAPGVDATSPVETAPVAPEATAPEASTQPTYDAYNSASGTEPDATNESPSDLNQ